jgi:hypothetical protein
VSPRHPASREAGWPRSGWAWWPATRSVISGLLVGPALGVVSGYSLSLAGTGMLLVFGATAWHRHRAASRTPRHAAKTGTAAEASLAP